MENLIHHREIESLTSVLRWNTVEFAEGNLVWSGRNRFSFNRLFLIREGTGLLRNWSGGQEFRLRAGYGYFMPLNLDLEFGFPAGLRLFSIHFQLELLPGFDLFAGNRACMEFELDEGELEEAETLIHTKHGWDDIFHFEQYRQKLLRRLIPCITIEYTRFLHLRSNYDALFDYIRTQADARTTIPQLAKVCNVPYDRFCRDFKREFKRTPTEFMAAELCRRAQRLLLGSQLSVKEISAQLGFGNPFYFSRFFRQQAGTSPRTFRKGAMPLSSGKA